MLDCGHQALGVALGRARHGAQRRALCGDGVGQEGVPADVGAEGAVRPGLRPEPGRHPQQRKAVNLCFLGAEKGGGGPGTKNIQ